jgi:ATP-dependent protease ClpP protease subunit
MTTQFPIPLAALLNKSANDNYIRSTEKTAQHHDVFLDSTIEEPSQYRELLSLLFNASEDDTVHIFINSNGGHLDTAVAIVEGLKATNANVVAILIGAVHSAASIISMYCHEVVVLDSAYSMVHTASFGAHGNTSNVKSHTEFTVMQVEKLLNDTYEGFLTKDELEKVKSGVELWFDAAEISRRMKSRVKFVEQKEKKVQRALNKKQKQLEELNEDSASE